jgi:outer membrane protein assembly factor BamD (BamD/ComL family)
MNIKHLITVMILFLAISCSKSPTELFDLAEQELKQDNSNLAINNLKLLISKHPNDSLASKAQYKLASVYLNWEDEISLGLEALKNTVNDYPKTIHAKQAQKEIDRFPQFLLDKGESLRKQKKLKESVDHLMFLTKNYSNTEIAPKGQYMLGDVYMNDFRDFTTAIQEYRKVIENYSGSSQEPHALFMIGYIYANVVNDTKSAKLEYENFINKFSSHELAPSVRFELEYLGKGIDEIPALKHITS